MRMCIAQGTLAKEMQVLELGVKAHLEPVVGGERKGSRKHGQNIDSILYRRE